MPSLCLVKRALLLVGVLLTLAQLPVHGQTPDLDALSEDELGLLDLDSLSEDRLIADLDAELGEDDLVEQCGVDLEAAVSTEEMLQAILCALRDEGDSDEEQELTWANLEAELREVPTTIEEVVRQALAEADRIAARHRRLDLALAGVAASTDAPGPARSAVQHLARDNFIKPGKAALPLVKVALRSAIRSRRPANAALGAALAQAVH